MRWFVPIVVVVAVSAACAPRVDVSPSTIVLHPDHPNGRVVLYLHGAGEDAQSLRTDPEKAGIVRALLAHGYTLASATAGGRSWGDGQGVAAYRHLLSAVEHDQRVTGVYILAQSMGGLAGLRLSNVPKLRAWAGIYPVCDLASVYRLGTYAREIRAAYGPGLSAALHRSPRFDRGVPVILWASRSDTVVPKTSNADWCARAARQAGGQVREITTTGDHGDPSNFQAQRLVRFFDAA